MGLGKTRRKGPGMPYVISGAVAVENGAPELFRCQNGPPHAADRSSLDMLLACVSRTIYKILSILCVSPLCVNHGFTSCRYLSY